MAEKINVYEDILERNNSVASANKALMGKAFCVNIMSSPGAGKTSMLENTLKLLSKKISIGVIEGDMATSNDARRLKKYARSGTVFQVKTENHGGGCHLDASMVKTALMRLGLPKRHYDCIIIENVGNLICPADFNLGETSKAVMLSVTEGDDKPLKYPVIFRAADIIIISKTDLLNHTNFSVKKAVTNIRKLNRKAPVIEISFTNYKAWTDYIIKTPR